MSRHTTNPDCTIDITHVLDYNLTLLKPYIAARTPTANHQGSARPWWRTGCRIKTKLGKKRTPWSAYSGADVSTNFHLLPVNQGVQGYKLGMLEDSSQSSLGNTMALLLEIEILGCGYTDGGLWRWVKVVGYGDGLKLWTCKMGYEVGLR
ncbi:hypothetical protein J6590_071627 [Homalodisca vitripennis]|nr:hypothetical protein J6590_071627 [Homalodisca vitripennis]